jgi:hypothetical protein
MFCPSCGNKIITEGNFCEHCGHSFSKKVEPTEAGKDISKEPLLTINVSKTQTLIFYSNFLVYKGQRINYTDIEGISYLCTRTSYGVYFVPLAKSSKYSIKIQTAGIIHKIEFSADSFSIGKSKGEKERDEIFVRFIYVMDKLIKPFVLINLLNKFSQEKQLKIAALTIKPDGLYRKGLFGKEEFLSWEQYHNAVLFQGSLVVNKLDNKKRAKQFFICPMDTINSVIMPAFLDFLFQYKGVIDEKNKQELINLKNEMLEKARSQNFSDIVTKKEFCWSCAAPIEFGQKFCNHCGTKLL